MSAQRRRPRRRAGQVQRRRVHQPGGQFGLLAPILKVVAPLVATEIAKFGIKKGLKRLTGKGMHGNGLLLAGQKRRGRGVKKTLSKASMAVKMAKVRAHRKPMRRRMPKRRRPAMRTLPFVLPAGVRF